MSFVYNRTISILREVPAIAGSGGNVGYSGVSRNAEDTIFSSLPASVQAPSVGSRRIGPSVPADAPGPVIWNIFIPNSAAPPLGSIRDRDFVVDENDDRYIVAAAYKHELGWTLRCAREEP